MQARMGLMTSDSPRIFNDLDPVIENLCRILRESLRIEDSQACRGAADN